MSETVFMPTEMSPGSNMIVINVKRNGKPFGQIWTFKEKGTKSVVNAKTLAGSEGAFSSVKDAKIFMNLVETF